MPDEEAIFNEARGIASPGERAAFVGRACGADADLRGAVEALLAAHDVTGGILDLLPVEQAGAVIGRYKLLEQIGEGGFGVVYMAEQRAPVRRTVALKIIKLGMDTKQVVARFEAERQALAMMDHPNIAKVFDAGATETGRPYFVMELVRGVPITEYCDQHHLPPRQRLELFVQVCRAVQHAHTKGVIHRDLKPANVLVTLQDADRPTPKVIDFGIVKATAGQRLTDRTRVTEFRQLVGTPLYMSPEQAEMSAVMDVDTRSDVYSLGVLLYELLTGTTPFDTKDLLEKGAEAVRRAVVEQDPATPSTRLSRMLARDLTAVAGRRRSDPARLVYAVRGDLDCIVMKCLEKDRSRRYETADGLAADVGRHLRNEPVVARPQSSSYRFRKMVRRNKVVFAAGGAVALAMAVGLAVSTVMFVRERDARGRAARAELQAEIARNAAVASAGKAQTDAALSEQVLEVMEDMVGGMRNKAAKGANTQESRQQIEEFAKRLPAELKGQPEVEARLRQKLGRLYMSVDDPLNADAMFREALRLRKQLSAGGASPEIADAMADRAESLYGVAGMLPEAVELSRGAVAMSRKCFVNDALPVARPLSIMGRILYKSGRYAEAEQALRESLAVQHKSHADQSALFASTLSSLASVLADTGGNANRAESQELMRRVGEIRSSLRREDFRPESMIGAGFAALRGKMTGTNVPAAAAQDQERALRLIREGIAVGEKTGSPGQFYLVNARSGLARWFEAQGRLDEAEAEGRAVVALLIKWPDWEKTGRAQQLRDTLSFLGRVLVAQRKPGEVDKVYSGVLIELQSRLAPDDPDVVQWRLEFAGALQNLNRLAEAEAELRALDALSRADREWAGSENAANVLDTMIEIGVVLEKRGEAAEAEAQYREAMSLLPTLHGNRHIRVARALKDPVAQRWNNLRESKANRQWVEQFYTASLEMKQGILGQDDVEVSRALHDLGLLFNAHQKYSDAEQAFRRSIAIRRGFAGAEGDTAQILLQLGFALSRQGKFAEAEQAFRESAEMNRRYWGPLGAYVDEANGAAFNAIQQQGRWADAAAFRKEAFGPRMAQIHPDHPLASVLANDLARAYYQAGQCDLGMPLAENTVLQQKKAQLPPTDPESRARASRLLMSLDTLARIDEGLGRRDEALARFKERFELAQKHPGLGDAETNAAMRALGGAYRRAGRLADAHDLLEKLVGRRGAGAGADGIDYAGDLSGLGWVLVLQGRFVEAEAHLREALEIRENKLKQDGSVIKERASPDLIGTHELRETPQEAWDRFETRSLLGAALAGQEKFGDAEPFLLSAFKGMTDREAKICIPERSRIKEAGERIARFYESAGRPREAAEWRAKLPTITEDPIPTPGPTSRRSTSVWNAR